MLATGDANGHVNVWDIRKRQISTQLQGDTEHIGSVVFSPNNRTLAAAGYEGNIKLWKVPNWAHLGTLNANGTVHALSFSPDSRTLAGTDYEAVNLWAVSAGEKLATLTGHTGWVNATAFSPDGRSLVSGGDDETLRIWDVTPYRAAPEADIVRIVYFLPRGRNAQWDMWQKLDTLIRDVQDFYADQMARNGFGRKTFTFETDDDGETLVYRVDGQFNDRHYHTETQAKVYKEVAAQFDMEKHAYLVVVDISSETINDEGTCGIGGGHWFTDETLTRTRGGYAFIPASGRCFDAEVGKSVTAHELGHAFGLEHDFRDDTFIMSYGEVPDKLSKCAAGWLDASRFFNAKQTAFNEPTTFQMLTPATYLPNARNWTLQFQVTDADAIHQAQLLVPATDTDPATGMKLHSCKNLGTQSSTLEFGAASLTAYPVNTIVLQVIDVHGNITQQQYTLTADDSSLARRRADVNRDGTVNVSDLVLVAASFGETIAGNPNPNPDVNRDGIVNVADLLLVASLLRAVPAAPVFHVQEMSTLTAANLQAWISQAKTYDINVPAEVVKKGVSVLEQLLATRMFPTEPRLLANYPNPFNPETWIPYQLAKPAEVTLHIYTMTGELVRTLALGHHPAGVYHTKNRAAHWDGRNAHGERVASGIYFYTLNAGGNFTATRKMLIQK